MASFGHIAVGLLAGRLHGGAPRAQTKRCSWGAMAVFAALGLFPDADVLLVACGAPDAGAVGHRGASHSLLMAIAVGLILTIAARRLGWPVARTAVAATLAVASHGLLDCLAQGGRGLPLLWPICHTRFHAPWRIIPDAPRGLHLISQSGLAELAIEFVAFLPITAYALWPHLSARFGRRPLPALTMIAGGAAPAGPSETPVMEPALVADQGPPVRSSG